jgi:hypothetical protein
VASSAAAGTNGTVDQAIETALAMIPEDDDGEATHCIAVAAAAELPSLVPSSLSGHQRARSPFLTFRAWVRDTGAAGPPRPLNAAASARVRYRVTPEPCLVGVVLSGTLRSFASVSVRQRFVAAMMTFATPTGGFTCDVELLAHVPRPARTESSNQQKAGEESEAAGAVAAGAAAGAQLEDASPWSQRSWADDGQGRGGALIPPFEASRSAVNDVLNALNRTLQDRYRRQHNREEGVGAGQKTHGTSVGAVRLAAVRWFDEPQHYGVPNGCATGLPPPQAYPQLYKLAAAWQALVLPRETLLKRKYTWVVRARWDLAWLRPPPPLETLRLDAISVG